VLSAHFGARIDERLGGRELPAADRAYVAQAEQHPLTLPGREVSQSTRVAAREADVQAFRLAMIVAGALMIAGAVIAGIGIQNPRRTEAEPVADEAAQPAPV